MAMKTIDFSYFIERYNTGEMDPLEKKWFAKELEGNTNLQEEVKLRKRVDDSLVKHDLIDLRTKLANLEKTRKEKVVASDSKKSPITRFAAAIAVLMLLGTVSYLISGGSANSDRIFESSFVPYEYSGPSRSEARNSDNLFKSSIVLYSNGDYKAAASSLKEYLNKVPGKTEASLLLGVSEMQNKNFESAINLFYGLCNDKSNIYLDHSQWYLALCYVKTGNYPLANREFEAIVKSGSIYESKARKIIKKIR
jgi:tetratricopeptide (TPR) repeat protein